MHDDRTLSVDRLGTVDLKALAQRFPEQGREIAYLAELYQDDAESPEEFRRLCELLHECGESTEVEYLLRRNLSDDAVRELYLRLFGTSTADRLQQAVESFAREFGVQLTLYQEWAFLDHEYESTPRPGDSSRPPILDTPCLVRISFTQREFVTANVIATNRENAKDFDFTAHLNLRFQDGHWQPNSLKHR